VEVGCEVVEAFQNVPESAGCGFLGAAHFNNQLSVFFSELHTRKEISYLS
jgi:hypothetical protein